MGEQRQRDGRLDAGPDAGPDGRPYAGHAAQPLVTFAPQRAGAQGLVQLGIQRFERLLQPLDVRGHLGTHGRQCLLVAMLLGGQQANHLAASLHQGGERLTRGSGQSGRGRGVG